jgi:hypothetical protein
VACHQQQMGVDSAQAALWAAAPLPCFDSGSWKCGMGAAVSCGCRPTCRERLNDSCCCTAELLQVASSLSTSASVQHSLKQQLPRLHAAYCSTWHIYMVWVWRTWISSLKTSCLIRKAQTGC